MSAPKPPKTEELAGSESQSITLRVQARKIQALDRLADYKGTTRSALIQLAIAEYLERNSPPKP